VKGTCALVAHLSKGRVVDKFSLKIYYEKIKISMKNYVLGFL